MRKCRILIDIDNTIVDPLAKWLVWGKTNSSSFDEEKFNEDYRNGTVDYNVSSYFDLHEGVNFLDFFRQNDLYDDLELLPHAKDIIHELVASGNYEVVFISYSKSWHLKSKFSLIKRNFPFVIDGKLGAMVSCKHKKFVSGDIIIDDRHSFLNDHPAKLKIKYNSIYTQDEDLREKVVSASNWLDVSRIIKDFKF